MTKVVILALATEAGQTSYVAVASDKQSFGVTAGAALDALTTQLPETDESTLVILPKMQPDRFFSATQQQQLTHLMEEWCTQREQGQPLPAQTQQELEVLVEAELLASAARTTVILDDLTP